MKVKSRNSFVALILLCILLIISITLLFSFTTASASTSNQLISLITPNETFVITDTYEVYGNKKDFSANDFENIVLSGENKVYLHYNTDRNIGIYYDALLCVKTNDKVFSFEFTETERSDADFLVTAIKSFINTYSSKIAELQNSRPQKVASTNNVPSTFIDCEVQREYMVRFDNKGYLTYNIAVSQYRVLSRSQLYIVTIYNTFVPGSKAREFGDKSYGTFKNFSGAVDMTVERAFDRNEEYYYGIRYGGETFKKDYWPLTSPRTVTITSSVQVGSTLGYSFKNGFSTDGISASTDTNIGLNISYVYSKAYTYADPAISVYPLSSNIDTIQWSYKYANKTGENEVCGLETNYMFELSEEKNSMCTGDFRLKLDYQFNPMQLGIARHFTHSADLFVGAGYNHTIHNFNNGLI